MATADQIASAGVYATDDVGLEVTDGTNVRAQLGLLPLPGNPYGLRVISSDGSTVIIDATSDVFKISASGTTSTTAAAHNSNATDVTLPGLGTFSATPAHMS